MYGMSAERLSGTRKRLTERYHVWRRVWSSDEAVLGSAARMIVISRGAGCARKRWRSSCTVARGRLDSLRPT